MKIFHLLLLGFLFANVALAQTANPQADAPNVAISKISWHKDVFVPALYDDPMRPNQEQVDLKREQRAIAKANNTRVQQGQNPLPLPTREIMSANREVPPGPSVNYLYQAKIKNIGEKTIQGIVWEYAVIDPESGAEIGLHRFTHNSKIRPGKTVNLKGYSATPAVNVISANSSNDTRSQYSERAVVNRIEYADGTFWQRPLNEP